MFMSEGFRHYMQVCVKKTTCFEKAIGGWSFFQFSIPNNSTYSFFPLLILILFYYMQTLPFFPHGTPHNLNEVSRSSPIQRTYHVTSDRALSPHFDLIGGKATLDSQFQKQG